VAIVEFRGGLKTVSFVAKVLVVFNLIVSAFFLYFAMHAWAAPTKWQKMYEVEKGRNVAAIAAQQKLEKDLAAATLRAQEHELAMRAQRDDQKLQKEAAREDLLKKEAELTTSKNENALVNAERQEEARENKRLVADLEKAHKVVMKLEQAVTIERANAQAMKNEKADMESALNSVTAQNSTLNRDVKQAQSDAATNANMISELIRRGVPVYEILGLTPDQPLIEAKVLAVKAEVQLVMLSVGSNNGVKTGYHFMVSNGATYKGTVQVDKVWADMCSARIILTPKDNNILIDKGDDARTR